RQELHPERQARLSRRNGVRSTSATGGRSVSKCAAQWSSREQRLADCVEYDSGSHCDQRERKENLQNPTATVGVCAEKQFDPVSGESAEQDARSDRDQSKPCRKALDFAHGTIQSSAAARHSIAILVTSPRFPVGIPDSQHFTPNHLPLRPFFWFLSQKCNWSRRPFDTRGSGPRGFAEHADASSFRGMAGWLAKVPDLTPLGTFGGRNYAGIVVSERTMTSNYLLQQGVVDDRAIYSDGENGQVWQSGD